MFEIDFKFYEPFTLESGETLESLELRCSIYGRLNEDKSNAILVFHALTGNSRIGDWWNGIIGENKALNTSENAFVCINYLGSCYGSTSASSLKKHGLKYKKDEFPLVTVRDIVRTNVKLFEHLGIRKFKAVIGGSVGGMLALQFAVDCPEMVETCIAIGATPLSAMGLALNHLQRQALDSNDLELARKIAMISYKSPTLFDNRFSRSPNRNGEKPTEKHENRFDIAGYLDYQGEIFKKRFELESYRLITKAMDLFDLSDKEIKKIKACVNLVGISSDWLFPAKDVKSLAERFKDNGVKTNYFEIVSDDGHDAFLSDIKETSKVLREILSAKKSRIIQIETVEKNLSLLANCQDLRSIAA